MKRPPGLWLLLTTVLIWLCIEEVYSIKATSLIFGKTTTTTNTAPGAEGAEGGVTESSATSSNATEAAGQNTTKLTGIPQIDYIYDPNLPRELNGYNLSEYPFYHRVPEEIAFKCDGLHDGFYASVLHKCQVYHHCLFGTRFDFLCANYTAFDQKTFICHFVSEVDCVNSKKFWHRNDALYQAASTAAPKPEVITPPPIPATPVPIVPILPRRPLGAGGRRRRPQRRRRPEYEYYDYEDEDELYDEPRRRTRPRYRPRPVYDDEYDDDYEEDSYDRRRRPYNRRRNNKDRRRYEDEEYEEEDDRKKRPNNERGDKRPSSKGRRPTEEEDRPRKGGQRRPADDDYEDRRPYDRPRKNSDQDQDARSRDRPKKNDDDRRPAKSDDEGRRSHDDTRRGYDRPRKNSNQDRPRRGEDDEDKLDEDKPMIKPVSGSSVYGKPRAPPRIRLPVPKNEQNKYTYKTVSMKTSSTKAPPVDEEYYEDYEEEDNKKSEGGKDLKVDLRDAKEAESVSESKDVIDKKEDTRNIRDNRKQPAGSRRGQPSRRPANDDHSEDEVNTRRPFRHSTSENERPSSRRRPEANENKPPSPDDERGSKTEEVANREPVIKVLKRPFLPSRGGSPHLPRGLQPVGAKALSVDNATEEEEPETQKMTESRKLEDTQTISEEPRAKILKTANREVDEAESVDEEKPPSPVVVKIPSRNKHVTTGDEEVRPLANRAGGRQSARAKEVEITEKPNVAINPLDIDESEYDVTLNDALNPTLPNLPVRGFPTGFSAPNEYTYNAYQRSRYVVDPTLNQASSDYVYTIKQPVSNYNSGGNQYQSTLRYNTPYQNFRSGSPQVTHAQTQPFYSSY